MPAAASPASVHALVGEHVAALQIPDLDAAFRLKMGTMIASCLPLMYEDFTKAIDVAAVRSLGIVTVATSMELTRSTRALAVGAPLRTGCETLHTELSGRGIHAPEARIGFEASFRFHSPLGTGDPLRYRQTLADELEQCGSGRMVLTMVRPAGGLARRLVAEPPEQTAHLRLHPLTRPQPTADSLGYVPDGFGVESVAETSGVFGHHDTDINQFVFTGKYVSLLEDQVALLLAARDGSVAGHAVEQVGLLFRAPFAAGARYVAHGTLYRSGDRTITVVTLHATSADGPHPRPSVVGRAEGRMIAGAGGAS